MLAGLDKANPIGAILSAALLLRYSLALEEEAARIEEAVSQVLQEGYRTEDISNNGGTKGRNETDG
jgi:3-isopropylmalate dehydrogenase